MSLFYFQRSEFDTYLSDLPYNMLLKSIFLVIFYLHDQLGSKKDELKPFTISYFLTIIPC